MPSADVANRVVPVLVVLYILRERRLKHHFAGFGTDARQLVKIVGVQPLQQFLKPFS